MFDYIPASDRTDNPACSICIAHYRGSEILAACLDSVINQDCDFEYEIIVHDDASDGESLEFIANNYPRVELLASRENVGFCIANNRMVEQARGKYILLLNNDTELLPDALSTLTKAAPMPGNDILTLPQFDWGTGLLVDRGYLIDPFYNPVPNLNPKRTEVAMVVGACLWISKANWKRLGGFPEWMGSLGEDLYLCCAARLSGLKVRVLNTSGYRHHQGHSFGGNKPASDGRLSSTYNRRFLSERNKAFTCFIMTPGFLVWLTLPLLIFALLIEGLILSLVKRQANIFSDIYLPAIHDIYKQRKILLEHRKQVQQKGRISIRLYYFVFTLIPRKVVMLYRYGWPRVT